MTYIGGTDMRKLVTIAVILLLCAVSVYSEEFFLDEDIIISNDGTAYIKGESNLDILSIIDVKDNRVEGYTQELTLKEGLLWKFVYKTDEELSYKIDLFLPEFSEIQFIESGGKASLRARENRHMISFEGENQPLDIEVGYVTASTRRQKSNVGVYWVGLLILSIAVGVYFLLRKKPKKSEKKKMDKVLDEEKIKAIKLTLNENQLKILEALIEKKGEASQTTLKHLTGVPKSSLSRNIELMSQRNIIAKFYSGTSNYVKIHPSLYKEIKQ